MSKQNQPAESRVAQRRRARLPVCGFELTHHAFGCFTQAHSHSVRLPDAQRRFVLRELENDLKRRRDEYGVDTSKWNLE